MSQIAAVSLVVLIALPFTAPFATCEVADLHDGHTNDYGVQVTANAVSGTLIVELESPLVGPRTPRVQLFKPAAPLVFDVPSAAAIFPMGAFARPIVSAGHTLTQRVLSTTILRL